MKTRFTGQSYVILSTDRRAQPPSLTPCQARRANVLAEEVWETSEMPPRKLIETHLARNNIAIPSADFVSQEVFDGLLRTV